MVFKLKYGLIAAVLALLSACGGGGGGGSTPVAAVAATATAAPSSPLITLVAASSYVNTSEEWAAFNLLNAERSRCGFGMLTQNAALDRASLAHANYQLLSYTAPVAPATQGTYVWGHTETVGKPGYTGTDAGVRALAAGYVAAGAGYSVSDDIYSQTGGSVRTGFGAQSIQGLLNAPYHARSLLSSYRDIGLAVRLNTDITSLAGANPPGLVTQIALAHTQVAGPQLMAASAVATYPCAGSTNIGRQLTNETPNPVPGRNLLTSPLGTSIMVMVRDGQTLTISSASMINVATGVAVTLRTPITAANDPAVPADFLLNQGYVAADAPLLANTVYQVTLNGSNNGTAFSRTFTFTTGL